MKMISIIIPTLNEEKYLPGLLESIKNQSLKPFEIIVADYNSTDSTREIARSFGAKIIKGGLPTVGRNNGAKKAKGDIYYFLDADVVLPCDFLKNSLEEMDDRGFGTMTADNVPHYRKWERGYTSSWIRFIDRFFYNIYNFGQRFLLKLNFPIATGTCIICNKRVFNRIKGFDETILVFEDSDFVTRASKKGKFGILDSTYILVSTRRFDKKGRFLFPLKILFKGIIGRVLFESCKMYNYFK